MMVIPAIDLKDGRCVRLTQGRMSDATVYNEHPLEVAREFAAAGAQMIHVVDLDGAFNGNGSPNRKVVKKIVRNVDVPVEFGGGVRSREDVQELCDAGVTRVVLGTVAAESPQLLKDLVKRFSTRICVGIDARDGRVMTRGWETATPANAVDLARSVAECGVKRIIYTDIGRDGMLGGPNIEQILAIVRAAKVSVTASGGVSSVDDVKQLRDTGESLLDSVIVGKALYEGRFKLKHAIRMAGRYHIL